MGLLSLTSCNTRSENTKRDYYEGSGRVGAGYKVRSPSLEAALLLTSTLTVTAAEVIKAGTPLSVAVIFSSILPFAAGSKASLSSSVLLVSTPVAASMVKFSLYLVGTMANTIFELGDSGSSASVACGKRD